MKARRHLAVAALLITVAGVATSRPAFAAGEPLSGTVTDSLGNPLSGVWVHATDGGMLNGSTTTASDGTYSLTLLDGTYQVSFTKAGYRSEVYDDLGVAAGASWPVGLPVTISSASPTVIDESLMRAPLLTGRVVNGAGDPVPANVNSGLVPWGAVGSASAAADGTFTVELPDAGTYRTSAWLGGYLTTYAPSTLDQNAAVSVYVGYDQTVDIGDLVMLAGGSITGTVSDSGGPLAGAQVMANMSPPSGVGGWGSAVTAADGTYTITGLPQGTYQVDFSAAGHGGETYDDSVPGAATLVTVTEAGVTPGIDAVLGLSASVHGVVRDPSGTPVQGAQVRVSQQGAVGFFPPSWGAVTDVNGAYLIPDVPPGDYVLGAGLPQYGETFITGAAVPSPADVITLAEGTNPSYDLQFSELSSLTVQVTQSGGVPLVGAGVSASVQRPGGIAWWPLNLGFYTGKSGTADANGTITFTDLVPGDYVLNAYPDAMGSPLAPEFYDDAYAEGTATVVTAPAGGTAGPFVIDLEVGGSVSGRITLPDGSPMAFSWVTVMGVDGSYGGSTTADADGYYTVQGLSPHDYVVMVNGGTDTATTWHPSAGDLADATVLTIGLGDVVTGIDVQMLAPARVEATILDQNGVPLAVTGGAYGFWGVGMCVAPGVPEATFSQCNGGPIGGASFSEKPADGQWIGTGVSPGTYNVAAFAAFPITISASVPLTLGAGDVATCTFQLNGPASCTVTHPSGGPADEDGVPDAVEDGVNGTGDGNGDGVADSEQNNVTSLPSPLPGGGYVTVAAPADATLTSVTIADPAQFPAPPPGATSPAGVIAYTVDGVAAGATVDIDVYLTAPTTADGYAKVQGGQWVPLPGTAFLKVSDTHFVLHLTDGGVGDEDGLANGAIVDPGAPMDFDVEGPEVDCPAQPAFLLHDPAAAVTVSVSDDGSGVAAGNVTVLVSTDVLGTNSVEVAATDLAGNSTVVNCFYSVGVHVIAFGSPVSATSVNSVKAGQTVPLKWRTVDALGQPVATPSLLIIRSSAMGCESGVVEVVEDSASTNGGLVYLGNGYWQWNWKTNKAWTGCRLLEVVSQGETATATMQFR